MEYGQGRPLMRVLEAIKIDVEGLYSKALRDEIPNFIGIAPEVIYEETSRPRHYFRNKQRRYRHVVKKIGRLSKDKSS